MKPPTHVVKAGLMPEEAAQVLGVSRQTVYAMINRGQLTRYKIGRSARLSAEEVYALVGCTPPDTIAIRP